MVFDIFNLWVFLFQVLALAVVSIGVAVATVTDLQFHLFGACIALAWIVPSAVNKILWSNLQQQQNWTALAYVIWIYRCINENHSWSTVWSRGFSLSGHSFGWMVIGEFVPGLLNSVLHVLSYSYSEIDNQWNRTGTRKNHRIVWNRSG